MGQLAGSPVTERGKKAGSKFQSPPVTGAQDDLRCDGSTGCKPESNLYKGALTMKKNRFRKLTAVALSAALMISATALTAFADDEEDIFNSETGIPTDTTTEYLSALSGATAAANTTVLEILGINVTSSDAAGIYNSGGNSSSPINLKIFGSGWNQAADPYLWNFYYNLDTNPGDGGGNYDIDDYDGWEGAYALISSSNKSGPSGRAASNSRTDIDTTLGAKSCNPALYYEPDLLFSGDTASSTSALITLTSSSYAGGWADYVSDGYRTSGYTPIVIGGWNTNQYCLNNSTYASTKAMAEGIVTMAQTIAGQTSKQGRYGSVVDIANRLYSFNVGLHENAVDEGYTDAIYCTGLKLNSDGTVTVSKASGRVAQYLDGLGTNVYDTLTNYTMSVSAFITAMQGGTVFGVSVDSSLQTQLKAAGINCVSLPTTVYGMTMQSADNMLGTAYAFAALYGDSDEDLPTTYDVLAYWLTYFYHVKEAYLPQAMSLMLGTDVTSSVYGDFTELVDSISGYEA